MDRGVELAGSVALGEDINVFLSSNVGRFLKNRAETERAAVLESMATCPLDSVDGLAVARKLQQRIAVIDSWQRWLAEGLMEAKASENELIETLNNR